MLSGDFAALSDPGTDIEGKLMSANRDNLLLVAGMGGTDQNKKSDGRVYVLSCAD